MKYVSRSVLASAVATALGINSPLVLAAVNIDSTGSGTRPLVFASEIGPGTTLEGGAANRFNITGKLGSGLTSGQVMIPSGTLGAPVARYFRFDLSGGAEFAEFSAANVFAVATGGVGSGSIEAASITTALIGGGVGQSHVIYSVTGSDIGEAVLNDATFELAVSEIKIVNSDTPVRLTYTAHRNDVSAAAGTSGLSIETNIDIPLLNYSPGFFFDVTPQDATADVTTGFTSFVVGANTTEQAANLGSLTYSTAPSSALGVFGTDGATVSIANIAAGGTPGSVTMDIQGNFAFLDDGSGNIPAASVFLSDTNKCVSPVSDMGTGIIVNSITTEQVLLKLVNTVTPNGTYICFERPADSSIVIQPFDEYQVTLSVTPNTGYIVDEQTAVLGDIVRDGTVLETAFFSTTPGYISRIMLSHLNPDGVPAPFTVEVQTDAGNAFVPNPTGPYTQADGTLAGELAPGTMLQINAAELGDFTGKKRGSAVFTIVGDNNNFQGIYQAINLNTGEVTNLPLLRPGGGDGQ